AHSKLVSRKDSVEMFGAKGFESVLRFKQSFLVRSEDFDNYEVDAVLDVDAPSHTVKEKVPQLSKQTLLNRDSCPLDEFLNFLQK
ncbi:hypothetical protein AK812_SmicGene45975, partial [Symbiodinium microadriaticum]